MGDFFQSVVDIDATDAEAAALGEVLLTRLVAEGILLGTEDPRSVLGPGPGYPPGPKAPPNSDDGMVLAARREVYDPGQSDSAPLCPRCGEEAYDAFFAALQTWHEGGSGDTTCPACGAAVGVHDWEYSEEPWACGSLGVTFWNWEELPPAFIEAIRRDFGGHRIVVIAGKL
jgi:ribosomal protein S27AE